MRQLLRKIAAFTLILALAVTLAGCAEKPYRQGMVTEGPLTFLCETVTDERAGTVAVTVTVTNGAGYDLYLWGDELTTDGGTTAAYLNMSLDLAPAEVSTVMPAEHDLTGLSPTGLTRKLYFSARESYRETRVFAASLPAALTVTVRYAAGYAGDAAPITVTFPLVGEE